MTLRSFSQSSNSHPKLFGSIKRTSLCLFLCFLIAGCYQPISPTLPQITPPQSSIPPSNASQTPISQKISPTAPQTSPTLNTPLHTIWLPPFLPEKLRSSINLSPEIDIALLNGEADLSIEVGPSVNNASTLWIYCLVAPFPTIPDGISSDELHSLWIGQSTPRFTGAPLLMDQNTFDTLTSFLGATNSQSIQVIPSGQLVDYAWSHQPALAFVPFENLEPRWKVLSIDGQSPLRKDFEPTTYPLSIPFIISGDASLIANQISLPASNRDPSKLTIVAMTGVTAMVRATAYAMELEGITYPAKDIGPLLASADITHISNEIPFWPDCPYPTPTMENLVFCSSPKYINLLKAVGTDIIELTGDHFMDHGAAATLYTLQMYQDLGWPYYGGGANAEQARQPVKLENNGNKIAFMGCNVGCQEKPSIPCDAIATDEHPGAAQCDYDWINSEIPMLRDEGYQVIFTFQHNEYYTYTTEPDLYTDFGRVAEAGATIVSGSQAHQPHGFSFRNNAFIHYGLGNLFFDQYHYCYRNECDDAFVDQHVFYQGKYISTELVTMHFVDYARPRLMTPDERAKFLQLIFSYSKW
jgi:Bacterial capsule synthesis protein PGA_cap